MLNYAKKYDKIHIYIFNPFVKGNQIRSQTHDVTEIAK